VTARRDPALARVVPDITLPLPLGIVIHVAFAQNRIAANPFQDSAPLGSRDNRSRLRMGGIAWRFIAKT
jgi:hypothetical protein